MTSLLLRAFPAPCRRRLSRPGFSLLEALEKLVHKRMMTQRIEHLLVVVKIEGKELQVRMGRKGWAGWIPKTEDERLTFQRQTLCPGGSRAWVTDGPGCRAGISARKAGGGGDQEKEQVPGSGGDWADGDRGGKKQESYPEERTEEKSRKARREFDAREGSLPKGKIVQRPVVK